MAKDKLVVRNLPYWVNEEVIRSHLASHPATASIHMNFSEQNSEFFTIIKLKKGKPAVKAKNRPAVAAWAIISLADASHCEKVAAAFDGTLLSNPTESSGTASANTHAGVTQPKPSELPFVEYTPLQSNAVPATKPADDDTECGKIFEDPAYLRFVAKLNGGISSAISATSSVDLSVAAESSNSCAAPNASPSSNTTSTSEKIQTALREADEKAAQRVAVGSAGNMKLIDHILKLWYVDDKKKVVVSTRRDRGRGNKKEEEAPSSEEGPVRKRKAKLRADEKTSKREKERKEKEERSGRGTMEEKLLRKQLREEKKQKQREEKERLLELIERKRKERQERREAKAAIAAMATATLKSVSSGSGNKASSNVAPPSSGSKFTVTTTRQGVNKPPTAKDLRNMPCLGGEKSVSLSSVENNSRSSYSSDLSPSSSTLPSSSSDVVAESFPKKLLLVKRKDKAHVTSEPEAKGSVLSVTSSSFIVTSNPPTITTQPEIRGIEAEQHGGRKGRRERGERRKEKKSVKEQIRTEVTDESQHPLIRNDEKNRRPKRDNKADRMQQPRHESSDDVGKASPKQDRESFNKDKSRSRGQKAKTAEEHGPSQTPKTDLTEGERNESSRPRRGRQGRGGGRALAENGPTEPKDQEKKPPRVKHADPQLEPTTKTEAPRRPQKKKPGAVGDKNE